jgi:hypothetical protein
MHPQSTQRNSTPKRFAVVGRVSTLDQERYGTSIEDQARRGELLAQLHEMQVIDSRPYQGDESGVLPLSTCA